MKQAVCDEEVTPEGKVRGILSSICGKVGGICMRELGGDSPVDYGGLWVKRQEQLYIIKDCMSNGNNLCR